jgi:hypothetical protein
MLLSRLASLDGRYSCQIFQPQRGVAGCPANNANASRWEETIETTRSRPTKKRSPCCTGLRDATTMRWSRLQARCTQVSNSMLPAVSMLAAERSTITSCSLPLSRKSRNLPLVAQSSRPPACLAPRPSGRRKPASVVDRGKPPQRSLEVIGVVALRVLKGRAAGFAVEDGRIVIIYIVALGSSLSSCVVHGAQYGA